MALNRTEVPRSLPYLGGKSLRSTSGTGRWIADVLPWKFDTSYVEPFAGMLGVLLQRRKTRVEIANDINERVVNFWRVLREKPDELFDLLDNTPHSRTEFERALDFLDGADPVMRAWAFRVRCVQSFHHTDKPGAWRRVWSPNTSVSSRFKREGLQALADRLRDVILENRDALHILEKMQNEKKSVLYCDPPYRSATGAVFYEKTALDIQRCGELLKSQKGKVAVSGYNDEWDFLGWQALEFETQTSARIIRLQKTEKLWINFEPTPKQGALI